MNHESHIRIAADSVESLRRCDVFRVVEWCPMDDRDAFCRWLAASRPDLSEEVAECLSELEVEKS